jgi:hypothetical protein
MSERADEASPTRLELTLVGAAHADVCEGDVCVVPASDA